jgi:four helix bundle protein
MKNYKKLLVWEKAHELVLLMYKETDHFLTEEKYGITSQIRRAAVTVPTNIAEGCGKISQLDFARYLQNAFGSLHEVEYLNFLSTELKIQPKEKGIQIDKLINELKAMLINLIKKVKNSHQPH